MSNVKPLVGSQSDKHLSPVRFPRQVLSCLSLSPRAGAIAAETWRLAQANSAQCYFLHIGPADAETERKLREVLDEAQVPADVELLMHSGEPEQIVEKVAAERNIDLILAGILNRSTTFSRHFESIAGRIAMNAPCSVLLLTDPQTKPNPPQHFVASVDFDDLSRSMLAHILGWGRTEGVSCWHLTHEYDPTGFYSPLTNPEDDSRQARAARLEQFIQSFDWSNMGLEQSCLLNRHGCEAIWFAQTIHADVLCMPVSRHRRKFWERMLRFGLDVDIDALPSTMLLYRDTTDN